MKTAAKGLRTAIYHVADMVAAKAWYAKAFMTEPYFDEPFYIGFNIGGYELGLHPEQNPTIDKPPSAVAYWASQEVEADYARLLALGATAHEEPQNVGGELVVASVRDPWGNIIGLIYNPDFKLP